MERKELIALYKEKFNKRPFGGWTDAQLAEKLGLGLEAVDALPQEEVIEIVEESTAHPVEFVGEPEVIEAAKEFMSKTYEAEPVEPVQTYKTDEDYKPELSQGLKTDKEVIAEMQVGVQEPAVLEYTQDSKTTTCQYLYKVLNDGAYRAKINEIAAREDALSDFIADLNELKLFVKEGEKKAIVQQLIDKLNNL